MITGFPARLRAALPGGWFGPTPYLDGVLAGFGSAWDAVYAQLTFVQQQLRLATVSGGFLDMAVADYTGLRVIRKAAETDAQLRARFLPVFREKATRAALVARLTAITGNVPVVFEVMQASDTGGYGVACAYGGIGAVTVAQPMQAADGTIIRNADGTPVMASAQTIPAPAGGGIGSMRMPAQFFVRVARPSGQGIPNLAGYGTGAGGYGVGGDAYARLSDALPHVTDQDIYDAINDVLPMGVIAWVALMGASTGSGVAPLGQFALGVNQLS